MLGHIEVSEACKEEIKGMKMLLESKAIENAEIEVKLEN